MSWGPSEPSFSLRLVQQFASVFAAHPNVSRAYVDAILGMSPDARMPANLAVQWLEVAVRLTGDANLGLEAAAQADPTNYDVVAYALGSAPSWGEGLEVMLRYIRLLNNAADFSLSVRDERAFVELRSRVPLNRAAADFQVASITLAARRQLGSLATFEVWIEGPEPGDTSGYRRVLGETPLRFGARHDAISFDAALLSRAQERADPNLNQVLVRHAERMLSLVPEVEIAFSERVRKLVHDLLPAGDASADYVATRLGMGRRTMARRLEQEGLDFTTLLEDVRREHAYRDLTSSNATVEQIALTLGYSETSAFTRAFKRWSGQTPAEFRRAHKG